MDDEHSTERWLTLGVTNRHPDMAAHVSGYLFGSIRDDINAYEAGYRRVKQMHQWHEFDGYTGVKLYLCSRAELSIGAIDAFDSLNIPVRLMLYNRRKGNYIETERTRMEVRT
jgi:hypothetical protein